MSHSVELIVADRLRAVRSLRLTVGVSWLFATEVAVRSAGVVVSRARVVSVWSVLTSCVRRFYTSWRALVLRATAR